MLAATFKLPAASQLQRRPTVLQESLANRIRETAAADQRSDVMHEGDYGAGDYPFGTEGDRPFVDEAQQAGRIQPWMFAAGGFALALVAAKLVFGR